MVNLERQNTKLHIQTQIYISTLVIDKHEGDLSLS